MPTIAEYLKYANLQMAAEAFLKDPATLEERYSGTKLEQALIAGNNHASRFPGALAQQFAAQWEVVDQCPNTKTGFSGTLFRCKVTDPSKGLIAGQMVISFRSTEFIDDAARDNLATNTDEIFKTGWAWGQIADMEKWYSTLQSKLPAGAGLSVTGYSLGGHLATAFNLLHPNVAQQVVTFNGAGVGKITSGTLSEAVDYFRGLLEHQENIDATFTDPALRDLYRTIRANLKSKAWSIDDARGALKTYLTGYGNSPSDNAGALRISSCLDEIAGLRAEAARVVTLSPGDGGNGPKLVTDNEIQAEDIDYRMAVKLASTRSVSGAITGGNIYSKAYGDPLAQNQFDIMGDTSPSMVANSQWHYGQNVGVYIEDQPLVRGTALADAFKDLKLLVDGYANNDFGDTHSLVLLVDSLSVMNVFATLDPKMQMGDLSNLFRAATTSHAQHGSMNNGQGMCEGDSLEAVVDALSRFLLDGKDSNLRNDKSKDGQEINVGNTWADVDHRNRFYDTLSKIQEAISSQNLAGQVSIEVLATKGSDAIAALASGCDANAIAYRYALKELNPFALLGADAVYSVRNADGTLNFYDPAVGAGGMTLQYIADRAKFLGWKNIAGTQNTPQLGEQLGLGNCEFKDLTQNLKITIGANDPIPGDPSIPDATVIVRNRITFGDDNANTLTGGDISDNLYGGGGDQAICDVSAIPTIAANDRDWRRSA